MQIFNYTHLEVDKPTITWEDILLKLNQRNNFNIINKTESNPEFKLFSVNLMSSQYIQLQGLTKFSVILKAVVKKSSESPEVV